MSETPSHVRSDSFGNRLVAHFGSAPRAAARECCTAPDWIYSRQNISPKRLAEPGPTPAQIEQLLLAAAAAPDHGQLTPWRFVIVPPEKRALLAEAFALALTERDPTASAQQVDAAREKAHRAPFLMLAIARLGGTSPIPSVERIVSLGCALQNMLLYAHAIGLGAGLTSGQALQSTRLRDLFFLSDDEQAICSVSIGTVLAPNTPRIRPHPAVFASIL